MGIRFFLLLVATFLFTSVSLAENNGKLTKHWVANAESRGAVCLDGSKATYYLSELGDDNKWVVMLGGGVPCASLGECARAKKNQSRLASSKQSKDIIHGSGLLLENKQLNPLFFNWNKVFVPQCSMDAWVGQQTASKQTEGLFFQGGSIVHEVVQSLKSFGIGDAKALIVIGNSAGGIGVLNHIDRIAAQLPKVKVKGIVDGGWILDSQPFRGVMHNNILSRFKSLKSLAVDDGCAKAYPNDTSKCLIGPYVYPHVQTPLLIRISQNDPEHLRRLGVGKKPYGKEELVYVKEHAEEVCQSLKNVNAYFSFYGLPHTVVKNKRVFSESHGKYHFYEEIKNFVAGATPYRGVTDCQSYRE